jgi:high-affinity iron transporter
VLPTFVIGLREGLEAALIIGIIAAFLIQRDERRALRWMWAGVALAIVLCLGIAWTFREIDRALPHKQQEALAAVMALLAVAGVTYMIVWMRRQLPRPQARAGGPRRDRPRPGVDLGRWSDWPSSP